MKKNKTTDGSNKAQLSDKAIDDPRVEEAAKKILEILAKSTKEEALARYDIGHRVNAVRGLSASAKYGNGVVEHLSRAVRLTTAALYEYANVAKTWTRGVIQEHTRRGVTFSHFAELAHPAHEKNRGALLERTAKERLSVRDLKAMRTSPQTDVLQRLDSEGPSEELREQLKKALKTARAQATKLAERTKKLEIGLKRCTPIIAVEPEEADVGLAAE